MAVTLSRGASKAWVGVYTRDDVAVAALSWLFTSACAVREAASVAERSESLLAAQQCFSEAW